MISKFLCVFFILYLDISIEAEQLLKALINVLRKLSILTILSISVTQFCGVTAVSAYGTIIKESMEERIITIAKSKLTTFFI